MYFSTQLFSLSVINCYSRHLLTAAAISVVILFWGLYAVDRELVFPAALDSFYPKYLNQQQVLPAILLLH